MTTARPCMVRMFPPVQYILTHEATLPCDPPCSLGTRSTFTPARSCSATTSRPRPVPARTAHTPPLTPLSHLSHPSRAPPQLTLRHWPVVSCQLSAPASSPATPPRLWRRGVLEQPLPSYHPSLWLAPRCARAAMRPHSARRAPGKAGVITR